MYTGMRTLSDGQQGDGLYVAQSLTDPLALWPVASGPVPLRGSPMQGLIPPMPAGEVATFQIAYGGAGTAASNSTTERTLTVTGLVAATDFVAAVNKPTTQAGLAVCGARISADATLAITFGNNYTTATSITPTSGDVWNVVVLRGFPVLSATLTPASVAANSQNEQIFTIAPTQPTWTCYISSDGKLTGVVPTGGGTFQVPPTIVIAGGVNPNPPVVEGGAPVPATALYPGGRGASAIAVLGSTGLVVGAKVTHVGSGYQIAPAALSYGGVYIAPGMIAMVTKPSCDAGIGIGNVRVAGPNQIGITYVNYTAATVITPASEAYKILALNSLPAVSKLTVYGINISTTSFTSTAAGTSVSYTVNGGLTTDVVLAISKPSYQAGLIITGGFISASNVLRIMWAIGGVAATTITPSAELYQVTVLSQTPPQPLMNYQVPLSPVSVASLTTAEQSFAVTGLVFTVAPSTVQVNKPSHQSGLAIVGARISAASVLYITYQNNSTIAITPTAEVYTVGNFTMPGQLTTNWGAVPACWSLNQCREQSDEVIQALTNMGAIKGYGV